MSSNSSSSSMEPTYAELVNRSEYVLSLALQSISLLLLGILFYGTIFRHRMLATKGALATSLFAYIFAQISFLVPSIVYNIYMIYAWLFRSAKLDVPTMFWLGLWTPAGTTAISCATFFLTLDRCFVLLWPISYPKRRAQRLVNSVNFVSIIFFFCCFAGETLWLELPLDIDKASYCLNHPCVATKFHYKYTVLANNIQCCLNVAIIVLFFILIRFKTQTEQSPTNGTWKKRNKIVMMTVIFEVVFKIVPGLACTLVNNLTSILISDYLGWYIMLFTSVDTFVLSIYYALVLLKFPKICCCFGHSQETLTKSTTDYPHPHHQHKNQQMNTVVIRSNSLACQNSLASPSRLY